MRPQVQSLPVSVGAQCNQSARGRQSIQAMFSVTALPSQPNANSGLSCVASCGWLQALLTLGLLVLAAEALATPLPGGGQQQEYFVRQETGEGLLITISGREAQFESRIYTVEDELVLASGVPGSRLAPLFQYIPPTTRSRQLDVRVTAALDTNRSTFNMGLSRIDIRDDRSERLAQGYQALSFGLELPNADTVGDWSIKVNALFNAARTFDDFGMAELALWARYLTAQVTLAELGDFNAALLLSDEILADPNIRRNPDLSLATSKLRLEALLSERRAGQLAARPGPSDPVQTVAAQTAAMAAQLGNVFERSEALYLAGTDFAQRGMQQEALGQFEQALDLAVAIEANDLATRVREDMVTIHGSRGDVAASSKVLQAIESQLAEDGADDELAQNLLAQGRILNRSYRYRAAQQALRQALEFEHNSLTRSQVRLELAAANYALGELDDAFAQAKAAVTRSDNGAFRRATPALDIGRGINIIAGVQRARGERSALLVTRDAQRAYLETPDERALWAWERAQDELVAGPSNRAVPWLNQVKDAASTTLTEPYRPLAQLWLCRLGSNCPAGAARAARDALNDMEIPRLQVSGAWAYAGWLASSGQRSAAMDAYADLLDELIFLRFSVPGVLGDWSWRRSGLLVEEALELLRAGGDASAHLLGLARAQWLSATGDGLGLPFDQRAAGLDTEAFRSSLARREAPESAREAADVNRLLQAGFARGREQFRQVMAFLSEQGVRRWMTSLLENEALLAFDLDGSQAYALLGDRTGTQRIALGAQAGSGALQNLLAGTTSPGEAAFLASREPWGERLLGPLVNRLPGRVYLAASGALAAAPFEAMSARGQRPLADRQLVRLASFPARPGPAAVLNPARTPGIFLAGEPQDFSPGFLERLATGRELIVVMDAFRGPGLEVVQGSALLPDEFATEALQAAGLVHLAMPAELDLDTPPNSYLELSEPFAAAGRARETPLEMARWELSAYLAVMGQAEITRGFPLAGGRMPLVSDMLAAGAQSVLTSVWRSDDTAAAAFFQSYYQGLNEGQSPVEALTSTRQGMISTSQPVKDWAAYQLWID